MASNIGIKIGVEGEKAFKSALADINRELKVSASEMQLLAAKYDGSEKSVEGLTEKQKALENQLAKQKNAVATIADALENAKQSFGETDARTLKWQESLNKAEAEVLKTEKAIKQNEEALNGLTDAEEGAAKGEDTLKASAEKTAAEIEEQKKKTDEAKKTLSEYAKVAEEKAAKALKALTAAAAGAVTGIAALVMNAGSAADELSDMSKVTGLSTTQLQQYDYTAKMAGTSLETITGAQTKLTKAMAAAKDESSATAKKFDALGVSVKDTNGELRSSDDVFNDVIDALGKIDNETERDAAAMEIFGKSAKDLNPLILEGSEGLKRYAQEAEELGVIVSEDTVSALADMQGTVKQITAQFDALKQNVAAKFAPIAQKVLDKISAVLDRISKTLDSPKEQTALNKLADAAGDFIEKAADLAEDILPLLIDAASFLVANFDKLAIAIGGVWAIFKTVSVVSNATEAFHKISGAVETLRASAASAGGAVGGLGESINATLSKSAVGVGAVTAAVGVLALAVGNYIGEVNALKEKAVKASQDIRDEVSDINDALKVSRETYSDSLSAADDSAKKATEYIKRLKELEKQSSLTNDEQREYNELVSKLKLLMPTLNATLDKNTGLLEDGADALEDQIKSWREKVKLEATENALRTEMENQLRLQRELTKARDEYNDVNDKYIRFFELQQKFATSGSWEAYKEMLEIFYELTGETGDLLKMTEGMKAAQENAGAAVMDAAHAYSESISVTDELTGAYEELSTQIEETGETAIDTAEEVTTRSVQTFDAWGAKIQEISDRHYETIIGAATNILKKLDDTTELSMKEIIETLQHNRQVIIDYEANMRTIQERGASEEVMAYLESLGIEQAGVIDLIANSTDKEFKSFVKNFTKNVDEAETAANDWGKRVGDGIIAGMKSKKDNIAKASRVLAQTVESAFKNYLQIQSPSRVMIAAGEYTGEGPIVGILRKIPEAKAASEKLAEAIETGYSAELGASLGYAGGAAGNGVVGVGSTVNNYYTYNVSDPSPAYMEAVMQNVNRGFGGLYA